MPGITTTTISFSLVIDPKVIKLGQMPLFLKMLTGKTERTNGTVRRIIGKVKARGTGVFLEKHLWG